MGAQRLAPQRNPRSPKLVLGTSAPSPPHSRRGETDQTVYKPGSVPPLPRRPRARRSFLWTVHCWTVLATYPDLSGLRRPYRIAPARDPYSVLLQAGLAMPSLSPGPRWALTPPFHPSRPRKGGGLLSVALSLGSLPAGVTRRLVTVEPGLSSTFLRRPRPPDRLVREGV